MPDDFRIGFGEQRVPPGHICHFGKLSEGIRIAAGALAAGIADGEHSLLVGDDLFVQRVVRSLKSRGIDAVAAMKRGSVTRLHGQNNGIALMGSIVLHLEKQAKCSIRLVGCPSYGKKGWPKVKDLLAFEGLMDEITSKYRALYLCIYDHDAAPSLAMHPHPKVIIGGKVTDNPAYVPGAKFREHLRLGLRSHTP